MTSNLFMVPKMVGFLKKYEIWVFLALAPSLNFVITYLKSKGVIEFFPYTNGRFYALMFLLLFIVKITQGNEGIKNLFRPMLVWKVHPKWYLFSLLFAFTIGLITLSIVALYSGDMSVLNFELYIPTLKFTLFLLSWAFLGEVVWIGYAVRKLSKIINPFYATQIIGFVWSLWWLPSVYINVGVIEDLPVWPLFLNMMGAAGMCAIVYSKTKSGICVLVIQSMLNMSLVLLPISPDAGDHTYTIFAVLYFLIMLVFMYFMPPKIHTERES
ncbi:MAG: hypothetical protein ABJI22_13995 [Maribacter sp.]